MSRTGATSKYGYATVAGIHGLVILPDEFTDPKVNTSSKSSGGSFFPKTYGYFCNNVYDVVAWRKMEDAGAVFLPSGGLREGAGVRNVCDEGHYWLSSAYSTTAAYDLQIGNIHPVGSGYVRRYGFSVRLVVEE